MENIRKDFLLDAPMASALKIATKIAVAFSKKPQKHMLTLGIGRNMPSSGSEGAVCDRGIPRKPKSDPSLGIT